MGLNLGLGFDCLLTSLGRRKDEHQGQLSDSALGDAFLVQVWPSSKFFTPKCRAKHAPAAWDVAAWDVTVIASSAAPDGPLFAPARVARGDEIADRITGFGTKVIETFLEPPPVGWQRSSRSRGRQYAAKLRRRRAL